MFGIGAKNKIQNTIKDTSLTENQNSHFQVHTMKDDLGAIESGITTLPQSSKIAPTIDAIPSHDVSESPFFEEKSVQKPIIPQKQVTSNPFFDNEKVPTGDTSITTPSQKSMQSPPVSDPHITLEESPAEPSTSKTPKTTVDTRPRAADAIAEVQQRYRDTSPSDTRTPPDKYTESIDSFGTQSGVPVEPFVGTEELYISESKSSTRRIGILISIIIATILFVSALLFVWFWWKDNIQSQQDDVVVDIENPDILTKPSIIPDSDKSLQPETISYSVDLPNYITLSSIGTSGAAVLRSQLDIIHDNIKNQNVVAPISFIVVNENETPYSFRSFAERTEIAFPTSVLEQVGELFELYAYQDQGDTRFGIAFDTRDSKLIRSELRAHEGQLGIVMREFLPKGLYVDKVNTFKDSIYGAFSVRYANLTDQNIESIDYTVSDTRVYIGTTMQTLRAVLEKSDDTLQAKENVMMTQEKEKAPLNDTELGEDSTEGVTTKNKKSDPAEEIVEFGTIPLNPGEPDDNEILDLDL